MVKKIKTSELIGRALDWAVAKCEGLNPNTDPEVREQYVGYPGFAEYNGFGYAIKNYSTDWAQGGPIKTRELIATQPRFLAAGYQYPNGKWMWQAHLLGESNLDADHEQEHESELVAAMRCYVASKLGDEVEIPEELL